MLNFLKIWLFVVVLFLLIGGLYTLLAWLAGSHVTSGTSMILLFLSLTLAAAIYDS